MGGTEKRILVVGGGFGGVQVALDLARAQSPESKITLVSDRPHFEFTPAIYRVVTGESPLDVCVPLREIFKSTAVELIHDTITDVALTEATASGMSGSHYRFDYLVLAVGSETAYFDIPRMREHSFGMKSIREALRLKRHLHEVFSRFRDADTEERAAIASITVVGGGATGVEIAGQLAVYVRLLARRHLVDPSLVRIDLIEASDRILSGLPQGISARVHRRLEKMGVLVRLNTRILKGQLDQLLLNNGSVHTRTVLWTAGVRPHTLLNRIDGLMRDEQGHVRVDEHLAVRGLANVFVVGDGAATPYSGMAQTAIRDGAFVARTIDARLRERESPRYVPRKTSYAVPVGPGWAAAQVGGVHVFGWLGWFVRRSADLLYFLSILPVRSALVAWNPSGKLSETCTECASMVGGSVSQQQ